MQDTGGPKSVIRFNLGSNLKTLSVVAWDI